MKKTLLAATILCASVTAVHADEAVPSLMPSMVGPLAANAHPYKVDTGYGNVYIGGVATGLGLAQTNPTSNDKHALGDIDNAGIIINKPDGLVQFFAHVGQYSIPVIGVPYVRSAKTTDKDFGYLAEGYVKLAPMDNFSVQVGKLPTLIGNEYTYTFENMNIERGLLWNQENDVNRGIQLNYTAGPVAFSVSWNDGYYSNRYTWLWGSASWTIDPQNNLTVVVGGNTKKEDKSAFATPAFQNNSQLYNAYFTHTDGPWTFQLNGQVTHVPEYAAIGALDDAYTYGAGAYASYKWDNGFSLPVRVEYIGSTGDASDGAPNLLYGTGSKAVSFTITPTWQHDVFFVRPEASFIDAWDTASGSAFGKDGNDHRQGRVMVETGIIF